MRARRGVSEAHRAAPFVPRYHSLMQAWNPRFSFMWSRDHPLGRVGTGLGEPGAGWLRDCGTFDRSQIRLRRSSAGKRFNHFAGDFLEVGLARRHTSGGFPDVQADFHRFNGSDNLRTCLVLSIQRQHQLPGKASLPALLLLKNWKRASPRFQMSRREVTLLKFSLKLT